MLRLRLLPRERNERARALRAVAESWSAGADKLPEGGKLQSNLKSFGCRKLLVVWDANPGTVVEGRAAGWGRNYAVRQELGELNASQENSSENRDHDGENVASFPLPLSA